MDTVDERLQALCESVSRAAEDAGRNPSEIELMAVTKTRPRQDIDRAYEAGIRLFGENRVGEGVAKFDPPPEQTRVHLIGHLQRNKARDAARIFDQVESIDKASTVEALLRHLPAEKKPFPVLLEMNTSGEESKHGVGDFAALSALVERILSMPGIRIEGLMTIAPFTSDERAVRSAFASLRTALDRLKDRFELSEARTLSMGMSSDYEYAIAEGATRIRIGTALFGPRDA